MAAQRFWSWVSSLSAKTTLAGTEELHINDAGTSKKTTFSDINTFTGLTYQAKTATVTAVTTTASPASTSSGTAFTNEGDADGATITLPTAAAGLRFTVVVQTAQTLTITAGAGDTIRIASSVTAAAGSITSAVVGSAVELVAINNVEWIAVSSIGSWSF